jgi:hypothetical protein
VSVGASPVGKNFSPVGELLFKILKFNSLRAIFPGEKIIFKNIFKKTLSNRLVACKFATD